MEWSYSSSKKFHQCQRQWYFHNIVANHLPNAKDPIRREAFLLAQLQSVDAWRGSIVDTVIDKQIIRPLNQGGRISKDRIMSYAENIFRQQLAFAQKFRSREEGMTKTKADDTYAALFELEYGLGIEDEALAEAWFDVEMAITNLLADDEIMSYLHRANYRIAQRKLYFKERDFTVVAVPDVIAFYNDAPPLIIDWKVHAEGNREYWLQLATYALSLCYGEPHKDFEKYNVRGHNVEALRLAEFQLLIPEVRWYQLEAADIEEVEGYIHISAREMLNSLGTESSSALRPLEFSPTSHTDTLCPKCPFQKMCGADKLWVK